MINFPHFLENFLHFIYLLIWLQNKVLKPFKRSWGTHILFIRSQSIQHTIYKMHANTIFFVNLLLYSYLFMDHCNNIFTHLVLFLRGHARLKSDMFLIMTPLIEDILRRKKMFLISWMTPDNFLLGLVHMYLIKTRGATIIWLNLQGVPILESLVAGCPK